MLIPLGILASAGGKASSFESIATITPTAGTINITFTSIPNTYKHLQLRCIVRGNWSGGAGPYTSPAEITFNSDTGANYASHRLTGNGSTASASGNSSVNGITRNSIIYPYGTSINSNIFAAAILDIQDYASTTKYKTLRSFNGSDFNQATTEQQVNLASGLWQSTSAITSINISVDGGAGAGVSTGSTFALYGIKG